MTKHESDITNNTRKPGRCFVAVVDIEADRCAVCLAELDAVQSEADIQADVCARRLSGRVGGQATNSLPMMQHCKQNSFITYLC